MLILDFRVTLIVRHVFPAFLLLVDARRNDELTTGLLETTGIVAVVILFGGVEWLYSLVAFELFEQFSLAFGRLLEDVLNFIKLLVSVRLNFC
jgi:hypothetical protein